MKAIIIPLKRIISGALIMALMLSLCLCALGSTTASAQEGDPVPINPSLPGIETLKKNGGRFDILEITPAADQGAIGYYVAGQEPTSGWRNALMRITADTAAHARTARATYVQNLMTSLNNLNLVGAGDTAPLRSNGQYTEKYPWETPATGSNTLYLDHYESVHANINSNNIETGVENGNFKSGSAAVINPNQTGDSNQLVTAFTEGQQAGNNYYYASLNFTPIEVGATVPNNTLVYRKILEGDEGSIDLTYGGENYHREGVVGLDLLGFNANLADRYCAVTGNNPVETFDNAHPYRASGDRFVSAPGNGWFNTVPVYDYVGTGGNINITGNINVNQGSGGVILRYNTVLYTGGYSSNQWFKRYVFNYSDEQLRYSSLNVAVNTKAIRFVNQTDIDNADLIVITVGTKLGGGAVSFSAANDFASAELATYIASLTATKPIVVQTGLNSAGANLASLANTLYGGVSAEFCRGKIYSFAEPLATRDFNTAKYNVNSNFSEVSDDIAYQNFLRERESTPQNPILPLDTNITMAACIRYIIAHVPAGAPKEKIRVLDIEPGGDDSPLDGTDVANMLNGAAGANGHYTSNMIEVTHMPIYELVGDMESLVENYDIIYIGSHFLGQEEASLIQDLVNPPSFYTNKSVWNYLDVFGIFSPEEYTTDYVDDDMDGLIYTNIGDRVVSGRETFLETSASGAPWRLSGLLDRDFTQTTVNPRIESIEQTAAGIQGGGTYNRNPSGLIGNTHVYRYTASIEINSDRNGLIAKRTKVGPLAGETNHTCIYQWYRNGVLCRTQPYNGDTIYTDEDTLLISAQDITAQDAEQVIEFKCVITESAFSILPRNYIPPGDPADFSATSPTYIIRGDPGGIGYNVDVSNNITRTFRYSGNDLSAHMLQELIDYADGRCPIIYADNLAKYAQSDYNRSNTADAGSVIGVTIGWFEFDLNAVNFGVAANLTLNRVGDQLVDTLFMYPTQSTLQDFFSIGMIKEADYVLYECNADGSRSNNMRSITRRITNGAQAQISLAELAGIEYFYCTLEPTRLSKADGTGETGISRFSIDRDARSCVYSLHAGVNRERVDVNSRMYELLDALVNPQQGALGYPNVFSETSARLNSGLLSQYVEVDKPQIAFLDENNPEFYPVKYAIINGEMTHLETDDSDGLHFLEYVFEIVNESSSAPTSASYDCNLYIDLNSDGTYSEDELMPDAVVRESNEFGYKGGARVTVLNQGQYYYLSQALPTDMYGLVPWKLEIVSASNHLIHTSVVDYTRVAPPPAEDDVDYRKTLNILQVNTSRESNLPSFISGIEGNLGGINMETEFGSETQLFGYLFAQVDEDFSLNIITVPADKLEYIAINTDTDENYLGETVSAGLPLYRTELLDAGTELTFENMLFSFDMLVLGFDDCYQELSETAADMIARYIDETDKAVLFSHDNASIFALKGDARGSDGDLLYEGLLGDVTPGAPPAFGFDFNATLRDRLGLDRYGVTSTKEIEGVDQIGQSRYHINLLSDGNNYGGSGGPVANSYSGMSPAQLEKIEALGYDIAYKPSKNLSDRANRTTVPETQGLTKPLLARYLVSGHYPTNPALIDRFSWVLDRTSLVNFPNILSGTKYESTAITQVNSGQITTYPFDLNTAGFGGTAGTADADHPRLSKIAITPTHFQYHQLNLNTTVSDENTVVWYCLASGVYDFLPNDVINDYYIYTRGNVTYTGFGHTAADFEIPYAQATAAQINEAQLLINTLLAAYRTSQTRPAVRFTDKAGQNELTSFLLPYDGDVLEPNTAITSKPSYNDESRFVYFTVFDTNPGKKNLSVSFKYVTETTQTVNGNPVTTTTYTDIWESGTSPVIYDAETGLPLVDGASLRSGITYYIRVDELLGKQVPDGSGESFKAKLNKESVVSIPIAATLVTQRLGDNNLPTGEPLESAPKTLTLRRLTLFNLG